MQDFWSSNLKFLRGRKKLSQEDLATQLGITRSKLNAHENGSTRNPPVEDLLRFSEFYSISIDVLIKLDLTKASALKLQELETGTDSYAKGASVRVLATTVDRKNNDNAEVVPHKARAGYTTGYGDPEFIAGLPQFSLPQLSKDRKYRMFPISGDSMHPVPDGAFVIGEYVDDWLSLKENTPCVIVTKAEGIIFKLMTPDALNHNLRMESLNELFKPYTVSWKEVLEVWSFKGLLTETLPAREEDIAQLGRDIREIKGMLRNKSSNKNSAKTIDLRAD